jgi:Putative adhesin
MTKALCVLALLFVASPAAASSQTDARTKQFDKTVALPSGGYLSLNATKGSVKLTSWDRDEVAIRALIRASRDVDADYARRSVEATTVEVTTGARDVRIRSNYDNVPSYKEWWLGGQSRDVPEIHYEIRAPRKLELRLDIDRSNTTLTGFEGRVDIAGRLALEADRGGHSRLEDIRGSLDLEADRTDVTIAFSKLDARSSIEVDRGDVRIEVPSAQGLTLDADLTRRSGFDSDVALDKRSGDERRFTADVNGGGPTLMLESDRGRIRLVQIRSRR